MKKLILFAKGVRALRSGATNAKSYPFWDELAELLKDYEVQEISEMPLDELEKLVKSSLTVVCVDSFIQHFCWSVDKKAVVLWGRSDPNIFGHESNINLLKSRDNLRPAQFHWWEDVPHSPDVFVSPQEVLKAIKDNFPE